MALYWIAQKDDGLCVMCGSKMAYYHIGEYCSNRECKYVDGSADLTDEEVEKFKDVIIGRYKQPAFNFTKKPYTASEAPKTFALNGELPKNPTIKDYQKAYKEMSEHAATLETKLTRSYGNEN